MAADERKCPLLLRESASRPDDGGATGKDAATEEVLRGGDNRTNLEKAVGRNRLGVDVTLAQQMERFPMLKGAPRALPPKPATGGVDGGKEAPTDSDVVALNFKPLGQVLRNVRCVKCSEWGHSMGDRECRLTGWDPFSSAPLLPLATVAASTSDAIDKACRESCNASAEALEDDRKRSKERKRHPKDERKWHARDDDRKSRQHKQLKSSKVSIRYANKRHNIKHGISIHLFLFERVYELIYFQKQDISIHII
jgi:CBF1 interacting corepressor